MLTYKIALILCFLINIQLVLGQNNHHLVDYDLKGNVKSIVIEQYILQEGQGKIKIDKNKSIERFPWKNIARFRIDGTLISETGVDYGNSQIFKLVPEYNRLGNIVKRKFYSKDNKYKGEGVYYYDQQEENVLSYQERLLVYEAITGSTIKEERIIHFKYDSSGNVSHRIEDDNTTTLIYSPDGKVVKRTVNEKKDVIMTVNYHYDDNGHLIDEESFSRGEPYDTITNTYDSNQFLKTSIRKKKYSISESNYVNDLEGNWIEKIEYYRRRSDEGLTPIKLIKRDIEYY